MHDLQNLIAANIVDESTKRFYESTPLGNLLNQYSAIKYDDVIYKNIKTIGRADGDMAIIIGAGATLWPGGLTAAV